MGVPIAGGATSTVDRPYDHLKACMAPRGSVADAAHSALFSIQNLEPHITLMGSAVLYATLCHRLRLDPADVHRMAMRLLRPDPYDTTVNSSLMSLRDFAGIRMAGEETTIG